MLTRSSIVFRQLMKNQSSRRAFSNSLLVTYTPAYSVEIHELANNNWPKTEEFHKALQTTHE